MVAIGEASRSYYVVASINFPVSLPFSAITELKLGEDSINRDSNSLIKHSNGDHGFPFCFPVSNLHFWH